MQSQPVLADDDADAEKQQQAWQAHSGGRPRGDDAGQQHEPTDQQHQIQLLQAHFIPVRALRSGGRRAVNQYDTDGHRMGQYESVFRLRRRSADADANEPTERSA